MTTAKKRILFVDDEPAILAGLQNLLYKDRKRWDMAFALGGELALDQMRATPFDVVVSDMRMPGMDGACLLNQVKAESPATVRIMLSGHADREAIVRALPALHQLLSKPCDAAMLRGVIEHSVSGNLAGCDARIPAVIGRLDKLPSPAGIYLELARVMEEPTTNVAEVTAIVVRDPGMSAKLLQLVNSAYFGVGHPTSSIEQAVALFGTERLRYIAMTASVFSPESDPSDGFCLQELQETSARAAALARALLPGVDGDTTYAAALLRDVGCAVLALGLPDAYRPISEQGGSGVSLSERELAALGVTHAEVGATLLAMWGLPKLIVDVVRHHHDPGSAPEASRKLAAAVHVADAIICARGRAPALDLVSLERAGVTSMLPEWLATGEAHA